ncbi:MAG: prenyltransferase [Antricoccus sp.]
MTCSDLPSHHDLAASASYIASCQDITGAIAWERDGKVDVWDHVECAMALAVTGDFGASDAAYDWLANNQRPDGTWPMHLQAGLVRDAGADSNQCAYVAVGMWHHWLIHRDLVAIERWWPTVRDALDAVVAMQLPFGGMAWARSFEGECWPTALVAGSASIWHSLNAGLLLADLVSDAASVTDRWSAAAQTLRCALRTNEDAFETKDRYSMDWYYPVLSGALTGSAARARLTGRWDDFVVPGLGIRCVDDHPWVTGAETCELALALESLGDKGTASQLVIDMQHLRDDDGSYHTGLVFTDQKRWPIERSSWTAAAVILAVDAIIDHTDGAGIFRLS